MYQLKKVNIELIKKRVEQCIYFFFQAEDGIRDAQESRGLGDVYKRQAIPTVKMIPAIPGRVNVASNKVKIPTRKNKLISSVMLAIKPNILYLKNIKIIVNHKKIEGLLSKIFKNIFVCNNIDTQNIRKLIVSESLN